MALMKTTARDTNDLVASGEEEVLVKGLRNGTLSMAQFTEIMCFEGRVFSVVTTTVSTPTDFSATGIITVAEPELMVVVPDGVTMIPLEIQIAMEDFGSNLLFEFMAHIGQGATTAVSVTDTDLTPYIYNVNTGHARASACTAGGAGSADATVMTDNVIEFWRGSETKAATIGTADDDSPWQPINYIWRAKDAGWYPICNGKGGLQVCIGAESPTGFIQLRFLEFPSDWLS